MTDRTFRAMPYLLAAVASLIGIILLAHVLTGWDAIHTLIKLTGG